MHRFYIPSSDLGRDTIAIIDPHRIHQIARVLRMKNGDLLSVFNDNGEEAEIRLLEVANRQILGQIMGHITRQTEPGLRISLYQAIPKKPSLFELVIEKATELGVTEIYPMITERTEKRRLGKFERLERIAIEATEQCNRTHVPIIHHPIPLETALRQVKNGYLAYEYSEAIGLTDYGQALSAGSAIGILIGPEGGFSQKEVDLAKKANVRIFSLGSRILRTETAAIAALALLLPLTR